MQAPAALPPYAYVPGQTARHDPALFAALHASVTPGMNLAELTACDAWRAGWTFYKAGFFWEAHEALEPVWMQTGPNSAARHLVQGLIQTANAALKARMGRPRAVLRLCDLADDHILAARAAGGTGLMGLAFDDLTAEIAVLRRRVKPTGTQNIAS